MHYSYLLYVSMFLAIIAKLYVVMCYFVVVCCDCNVVLIAVLFGCIHLNNYHLVTFYPTVETVDLTIIYMCTRIFMYSDCYVVICLNKASEPTGSCTMFL